MSVTLAVARREFSSFFRLPLGWIAMALFVFLAGAILGVDTLRPGHPASMRVFFAFAGWVLLPIVPAISMRLVSEELRSGTIEPLLTSPASDYAVVLGKYLGSLAFLLVLFASTGVHVVILLAHSSPVPDLGPIGAGYLCLSLVAALYLAIGLLASSLTSNQTLAFLATFFALLALLMAPPLLDPYLPASSSRLSAAIREGVSALAVNRRVTDFARGIIDTSHLVFFISLASFLVFLSGVALESRRWR